VLRKSVLIRGDTVITKWYGSTKTLFKIHICRVRRKRQRLPSNGAIETAPALTSTLFLAGGASDTTLMFFRPISGRREQSNTADVLTHWTGNVLRRAARPALES
jgi:hypothetical protein